MVNNREDKFEMVINDKYIQQIESLEAAPPMFAPPTLDPLATCHVLSGSPPCLALTFYALKKKLKNEKTLVQDMMVKVCTRGVY